MSLTYSTNQLQAGHWRYASHAMVESLRAIIAARSVRQEFLSPRLLVAAKELLQLALNARIGKDVQDLSSSIANYRVAADALRRVDPTLATDRSRLDETMQEYAELLADLAPNRPLNDEDLLRLKGLQSFFQHVFRAADAQIGSSVLAHELLPLDETRLGTS